MLIRLKFVIFIFTLLYTVNQGPTPVIEIPISDLRYDESWHATSHQNFTDYTHYV